MRLKLVFADLAWEDFTYWIENDRRMARRVIRLIEDCRRSPYDGIGKPGGFRANHSGYWSRRITEEHRLVYKVENG